MEHHAAALARITIAATLAFFAGVHDSDLQVRNDDPPPRWVEPPASREQVRHAVGGLVTDPGRPRPGDGGFPSADEASA